MTADLTTTLTIRQLGDRVGLTPKTIRFYEEAGILSPTERAENGYRKYSEKIIPELEAIKYARDLGLPLAEIKKLMAGCEGRSCEHTRAEMESHIGKYVELLEAKIAQFQELKTKLEDLQTGIRHHDNTSGHHAYCCNLLHQLPGKTKGGELDMSQLSCNCGEKCTCGDCQC